MLDAAEPARSAWLYDALLHSELGVVVVDAAGTVRQWSPAAAQLFGVPADAAMGRPLLELGLFADRARQRRARRTLERVLAGERLSGEWTARRPDGSTVAVRSTHQPLVGAGGTIVGCLSVTADLSDRERLEHALLREALLDPLTQLPNRLVLQDALARLGRERRRSSTVAVLFVDLDEFKLINDVHGHAAGDRVLQEVARRLRATVRDGDLVGRLGGDEFVLVCQVGPRPEGARELAQRLASALAPPVAVGATSIAVTASIGVACAAPGTDPEELLERADRAMYRAKDAGRGGFRISGGRG